MAKYIVKFTPKRGNSENSDLEKLINKMSSSCEKIAPATFVINSEKTVRRIVKSLASRMGNKGNFVEEFYTAFPATLYDNLGANSAILRLKNIAKRNIARRKLFSSLR